MIIFQTIAGLINIVLMFLFFIMPIWIPILILKIKYKKDSDIIQLNNSLLKFIFNKNKFIWLNSFAFIVLLSLGFYFILNAGCDEMACLAQGFVLAPFVFSLVVIGIILIVTLISSITQFYYPNQKKFIIPKYIKIALYILIFGYLIYSFFGPYILILFN